MLIKLSRSSRQEAAQLLADYWSSRGMPAYDRKWAAKYLTKGHGLEVARDEFFAMRENGKLVGIVSLITDVSGVAEIRDLVVKPAHRGKGYGRVMLKQIVSLARRQKIRKVFVLAFPRYRKLYESLGFAKEGILKDHFAKGENLIVMSRFLEPLHR